MFRTKLIYDDVVIASHVVHANTFWKRLKGLMFQNKLDGGLGLLINPCKQIHTFGMRFPIDVLFLAQDDTVLEIMRNVPPGKVSRYIKKSKQVLEVAGGTVPPQLQPGKRIKHLNETDKTV